MQITTIGLDIAKNVFQVHGIDAAEKVVVRKQLRRSQVMAFFAALPPCLIGMEACATAHHWARELTKLGHEVRLMPAKDVKAYVKRNKNDAADAEAICEAVRRPTMRFVRIKSAEQQGQLMQHRTRDLLMRQRTQVDQCLAGASGRARYRGCAGRQRGEGVARDRCGRRGCALADRCACERHCPGGAASGGADADRIDRETDHRRSIARTRRASELRPSRASGFSGRARSRRRSADPTVFRSGRDFAAWIGLVPRQDSTGGKQKLGPISKQGDRYLRRILVVGAHFRVAARQAESRRNIPGSRNSWRGDPSRSWRWRLPTRWLAWPGRCWPMVAPIGRLCLRQRRKELWRWEDEVASVRS